MDAPFLATSPALSSLLYVSHLSRPTTTTSALVPLVLRNPSRFSSTSRPCSPTRKYVPLGNRLATYCAVSLALVSISSCLTGILNLTRRSSTVSTVSVESLVTTKKLLPLLALILLMTLAPPSRTGDSFPAVRTPSRSNRKSFFFDRSIKVLRRLATLMPIYHFRPRIGADIWIGDFRSVESPPRNGASQYLPRTNI